MSTEIEAYEPPLPAWVRDIQPAWELAKRLERAGEFVPKGFENRGEAIMAVILTGTELGHGPMWALRNMHVINGKPGLSAEAMRALVLAAGHEITYPELTDEAVTAVGRRAGSEYNTSVRWTLAQAKRANLTRNPTWNTYPRAMLTARATAELCRLVFPDVVAGMTTTEEIADGFPLEPAPELAQPPRRARRRPPTDGPASPPSNGGNGEAPVLVTGSASPAADPAPARRDNEPPLPGDPDYDTVLYPSGGGTDAVRPAAGADHGSQGNAVAAESAPPPPPIELEQPGQDVDSDHERKKVMALARECWPGIRTLEREQYRHALTALVTMGRTTGPEVSSRQLDLDERLALTNRLNDVKAGRILYARDADGNIVFTTPSRIAVITPPEGDRDRWLVRVTDREP